VDFGFGRFGYRSGEFGYGHDAMFLPYELPFVVDKPRLGFSLVMTTLVLAVTANFVKAQAMLDSFYVSTVPGCPVYSFVSVFIYYVHILPFFSFGAFNVTAFVDGFNQKRFGSLRPGVISFTEVGKNHVDVCLGGRSPSVSIS